jgi:hypothetical protein
VSVVPRVSKPRRRGYLCARRVPDGTDAATVDVSGIEVSGDTHEVFADAQYDPIGRQLTTLRLNGWGYRWIRLRRGT